MSSAIGRVGGLLLLENQSPVIVGYTRKSRASDIPLVADNMRQADIEELRAGDGATPREALLYCLLHGRPCMTICKGDDTPVAMWGVVPAGHPVGRVWMLGTDELVQNSRLRLRFLREVKQHFSVLDRQYAVLWNCVDARNTVHVRWIKWMGFTFIAQRPNYGAEGRLFLEFCKASPCALQLL